MERTVTIILAIIFMAAGLLYVFMPETALALTGEFQLDSSALLDARASYGGLQLGLGIALLAAALKNQVQPVLGLTAVLLFFVGTIRGAGYVFSPDVHASHLLAACFEFMTAVLLTVLIRRESGAP